MLARRNAESSLVNERSNTRGSRFKIYEVKMKRRRGRENVRLILAI